ncbi:hemolysin family protein [Aeromicrobium wangtongii]|uniref:Hemolysin family protein n=1 Tax=Aeromicrobium wangtongii TaxID=2969247 RepID=A0ABY5M9L7_9ACTN|nr:hemolysin family protein [Aeromicrobium wangtongii]MCD9197331.1 hemolysin family protein [Aeromicrobium wangtongii]MCL3818252.1 hemolysin family protein [Aeromicrobium wangtongii]UUP14825.1 hemolysin family protein [Aeromicrobium wangtongii]
MSWLPLLLSVALAMVAGTLASVDAAISAFSKARAEELDDEGRSGAGRLAHILDDPAPYLNSVLLIRVLAETASIVLVALVVADELDGLWTRFAVAVAIMTVVGFVLIGVAPRTLGRQHAESIALASALPVVGITRLLGPVPKLLILLGNAITPGKGFREGPFASEVEVRELVDLAAASSVIETDEGRMLQSVFELGDTIAREVMVPRTDLVFVEKHKTLRQAMSLALRSGYSRMPVIDENLDDVVGMAYLKDITKRVFDNHTAETTERIESITRPCLFVPDTKAVDELLKEMQAQSTHVAIVVDEYGGTSGMITIEDILEEIVGEITDEYDAEPEAREQLADGSWRVSSRFEVDDLEELFDIPIEDDDVDSVGGLMAKHLGKVPIRGSVVEVGGLRFEAEGPSGRRNRIGHVLVSRLTTLTDDVKGSDHGSQS